MNQIDRAELIQQKVAELEEWSKTILNPGEKAVVTIDIQPSALMEINVLKGGKRKRKTWEPTDEPVTEEDWEKVFAQDLVQGRPFLERLKEQGNLGFSRGDDKDAFYYYYFINWCLRSSDLPLRLIKFPKTSARRQKVKLVRVRLR